MSNNNYGVMNAMVDIIASPSRAWDEIREHNRWFWIPLLLLIVLTSAAFTYFYMWVDYDWFVEETIRSMPAETRAEAAPGVRSFMSPTFSIGSTVAAVVFMTFFFNLILATYYLLVSKFTSSGEIRFGQWFSLSVWSGFPGIFSALAIFMVIFLADSNQVGQTELSPLSLNALLFQAEAGDTWFTWANSVNLIMFWSIFLAGLGISRWTASSLAKGLIIAGLPFVLIFGIWAAIAAS